MRRPHRVPMPSPVRNVALLHVPPAPAHLEPDEAGFWDRTVRDFAIESDAALKILAVACDAAMLARQCREQIAIDGVLLPDHRGRLRAHPLLKEAAVARNGFLAAMKALHLDLGPDR